MSLATFTKERRMHLGLSLTQVAMRSGSTKSHIHDIEHGRSCNPTCSTVVALAAALQVSAVELFRHAAELETPQSETTDDKSNL